MKLLSLCIALILIVTFAGCQADNAIEQDRQDVPQVAAPSPATRPSEPSSVEDCQPGGYWLKKDPAEGHLSILMMCPG